jgi:hypothetical protein
MREDLTFTRGKRERHGQITSLEKRVMSTETTLRRCQPGSYLPSRSPNVEMKESLRKERGKREENSEVINLK